MKEVLDAVTTRIQAPYFGYSLLACLGLNWKAFFLLAFMDSSAQERIVAFEQETSILSVVAFPLLFGAIFAIITPWSRYVFELLSQKPFMLREQLQLDAEHRRTIQETRLEKARSELFSQHERELINRAKRDEEIANIDNDDVRESLLAKLNSLRSERDHLAHEITAIKSNNRVPSLSDTAFHLLRMASEEGKGMIVSPKTIGGRSIRVGRNQLGSEDAKSYAMYEAALEELERNGYVKPRGEKREIFEVTHKGWGLLEVE